jgi:hypothetical protein
VSWFLIDETAGLALTRDDPVERTLATSGSIAYLAWVLDTIGGIAGGTLGSVEPLADALFPVLFVGLAALTTTTRSDTGRALLAALSLTGSDAGVTDPAMLAAVGCALLATRWSWLLITLGAGLGGFLVASLIW